MQNSPGLFYGVVRYLSVFVQAIFARRATSNLFLKAPSCNHIGKLYQKTLV